MLHQIPRSGFEGWLKAVLETEKIPSLRSISKSSGISKSTLSYQLNSDTIPAATILKISRGLDLSPTKELSKFKGFEPLNESSAFLPKEILPLIAAKDIYLESALRLGADIPAVNLSPIDQGGADIWSSWFKAAAPNATYAALKNLIGISETQIARNNREAAWSVEQIIAMAQVFSFSPVLGLAAAGSITFNEAGLTLDARTQALRQASNEDLQAWVQVIAPSLTSDIKQNESTLRNAIIENLG